MKPEQPAKESAKHKDQPKHQIDRDDHAKAKVETKRETERKRSEASKPRQNL